MSEPKQLFFSKEERDKAFEAAEAHNEDLFAVKDGRVITSGGGAPRPQAVGVRHLW